MFAKKSVKDFNANMFLEELKKNQELIHFSLIKKRWKVIQNYYSGDLESSITQLKEALDFAKENKVAEWLIKDILIDLRNLSATFANSKDEIMVNYLKKYLVFQQKRNKIEENIVLLSERYLLKGGLK